ncbi:MAG: hypothetical protein E6G44_04995 [Actinobacteria bacterium]|nr:MAG: hypothetical protein E6G44_04995 [Actinomycetota bacterium]
MAWLAPSQSTGAHQARPKSRPAAGHGKAAHRQGDHKRATRHRTAVEPSAGHGMPSTARSQYLKTTHSSVLNRMGCAEGRRLSRSRDESAIVVLAFGRPVRRGHGHWGASLFGRGFRSIGQIQRAAQAYGRGFARCAAPSGPHLTVAIGTSNFGPGVTYRHGAAWAAMVNGANEWVDAQDLAHRLRFAGASDIELSWNGPRTSKRWVRGYDSVARWPYYDYGDAAGCPPRGNCLGGWTQEDVWFVSWGARTAWPLPEIYTGDRGQAEQWYRLSLYSYLRHGWRMTIAGALSQRTACRQSSDTCRGMNNSPARAWGQLDGLLNRDFRTAQRLRWSSDFAWAR